MCERLPVQAATDEELLAVHTQQLLDAVAGLETSPPAQLPAALQKCVGEDMLGNRASHRAARQAAGSAAELARKLVFGMADNGLALLRPAGGFRETRKGAGLSS
jgi:histone deacetylase 6